MVVPVDGSLRPPEIASFWESHIVGPRKSLVFLGKSHSGPPEITSFLGKSHRSGPQLNIHSDGRSGMDDNFLASVRAFRGIDKCQPQFQAGPSAPSLGQPGGSASPAINVSIADPKIDFLIEDISHYLANLIPLVSAIENSLSTKVARKVVPFCRGKSSLEKLGKHTQKMIPLRRLW